MRTTAQEMELAQVPVGAKLAAPVVDDGGRVLMPAGALLNDSALASLERREIASVSIEVAVELNPEERAALRQRVEADLNKRFRHAGDDTETRALFRAVLEYRMEEAG